MPGGNGQEEPSIRAEAEVAARAEWERLAEESAPRRAGRERATQLEESMRRALGELANAPADFTDALQKLREEFSRRQLPPSGQTQVPAPEK